MTKHVVHRGALIPYKRPFRQHGSTGGGGDYYNYRLGNVRKTEKTDYAILQHPARTRLGRVRHPVVKLPPSDYAYGRAMHTAGVNDNVHTALSNWVTHASKLDAMREAMKIKDHISMNKRALHDGHCTTCAQNCKYRREHADMYKYPHFITPEEFRERQRPHAPPYTLHAYHDDTEMGKLMGNGYYRDWFDVQIAHERKATEQSEHIRGMLKKFVNNRSHIRVAVQNAAKKRNRFGKELPRRTHNVYENVPGRLQTKWDKDHWAAVHRTTLQPEKPANTADDCGKKQAIEHQTDAKDEVKTTKKVQF